MLKEGSSKQERRVSGFHYCSMTATVGQQHKVEGPRGTVQPLHPQTCVSCLASIMPFPLLFVPGRGEEEAGAGPRGCRPATEPAAAAPAGGPARQLHV